MTTYLTKSQYSSAKRALTRAQNSGVPANVIREVTERFEKWDDAGVAYPDDWHRWHVARYDAETQLRYDRGVRP